VSNKVLNNLGKRLAKTNDICYAAEREITLLRHHAAADGSTLGNS
jgi:hypothetical protein